MSRIIIYQVLPRLFGNDVRTGVPDGTLQQNGCGKFNDFTDEALKAIRDLGATHIWYTGVLAHASGTSYPEQGIEAAPPQVLKGKAGSPYAVRDYYDVDPDLAVHVPSRMAEFEALVKRTHRAGLQVLMDFVPNHVARTYRSAARPAGVRDLGEGDRTGMAFHPSNNFYYLPDRTFVPPVQADGGPAYVETPARVTGNDCFTEAPSVNDWYETVKLNYGVDRDGREFFSPLPGTWLKMRDILLFWASKGIDGFRCDMAEMVPAAFWKWAVAEVKRRYPALIFVGEVYQPQRYRTFLESGFDYLYDKVGLYDTLRGVMTGARPASDITGAWQAVEGIQDHMLSFLENHDEQRIASDFFAGSPLAGRPAFAVAALMRGNPLMVYAGQELGEPGMQAEGFSGRDGRTSIFDYAAVPCLQQWRNGNRYDDALLSPEQRDLRQFYRRVMHVAATEPAAVQGQFYDVMYVAPEGFDRHRQYAFLRWYRQELLLVVANFGDKDCSVPVQVPAHAFAFLKMEPDLTLHCTELLTGSTCRLTFSPDYPLRVEVPAQSAVVYKARAVRPPSDCRLPHEAGTAVPVFSLRSSQDAGIGEFADLRLLVDWAAATGQRWIQTLPVNDTTRTHTWRDSYPYNAVSAFALHPLYIRLQDIGPVAPPDAAEAAWLERSARSDDPVDYEAVDAYKWKRFKQLYRTFGRRTLASAAYRKFHAAHRAWLEPYAVFCCLRDRYGTADFRSWPQYADYDASVVETLLQTEAEAVGLYCFLQYHAFRQLSEVHAYARSKGVHLKGDLPIGVSRDGADIWQHPELFDDTMQAGAPPDDFSDDGQNWGFPVYRWQEMAKDGYGWWKNRLRCMSLFFDAYRIDHILGFFRIFAIPRSAMSGLLGRFEPAMPLTAEDIRRWGVPFDKSRFVLPYLDEAWVEAHVPEALRPEVKRRFLLPLEDGAFTLKPAYRSQRAVAERFATARSGFLHAHPGLSQVIQQACTEVLLVEDRGGGFHPRINVWKSASFRALDETVRQRFMVMYHDFFHVRHNGFWKDEAMRKLPPLLESTGMTACGEDLGMIPDCVPEVMQSLHILSLEIFRMPKVPQIPFGILKNNPYESVCTTSSHDTSTLRGWWEEQHEDACRYYHQVLHLEGDVPYFCEPWLCERILSDHLQSPSRLAIFPLQDWLSVDGGLRYENARGERINVPSDVQHYWRWRMHIPLEDLLRASSLNGKISLLVQRRCFTV